MYLRLQVPSRFGCGIELNCDRFSKIVLKFMNFRGIVISIPQISKILYRNKNE